MDRALASACTLTEFHFRDGLGDRLLVVDAARGETLELLSLRDEIASVPSFEFALRERVSRLSNLRHAYYTRVRGVERLTGTEAPLAVVSDQTTGVRLSELLAHAHDRQIPVDINAAICLLRQIVPAVAMLHEHARDVAHGALGPERLIVTPNARIAIVEYVLGAALEQLQYSRERYWKELRVPLPRIAGAARFDHRTDVMQIGMVALSLILGRLLSDDEYPAKLGELLASTWAVSAKGGFEPLPPGLRGWLGRALQLDARGAFASATDASAELDRVLGDSDYIASPSLLEAFLSRYHESMAAKPAPLLQTLEPRVLRIEAEIPSTVPPANSFDLPAGPEPLEVVPPPAAGQVDPFESDGWTPIVPENDSREPGPAGGRRRWIGAASLAAGLLLASGVVLGARHHFAAAPLPVSTGKLIITTNPIGAQAFIDGAPRGQTPLTLMLPAGAHVVEVRGQGTPRSIPVVMSPGGEITQYIDLPAPAIVPQPIVASAPPKAAPIPEPVVMPGWVEVSAPIDVQVYEHDRLLGSNAVDRIMLPSGRHELDLVNETLGYRSSHVVQITPGKATAIKAQLPKASIALNALPWADVWIDGELVGETPIGDLAVSIGSHDIVFRHPQLGEQHYSQVVTLKAPVRLSVDLRKK